MAQKSHLSDEQITLLKTRLFKDREKLQKTIANLEDQDPFNNPDHVNDNAAIDTDIREQMGHATVEAEMNTLKKKVKLIEKALRKMDKGTYGLDEKTGTPIPFERLQIVPEAQYTVETGKKLVK